MKKTSELNINEYIMLAEEKVGHVGELEFQTFSKRYEDAGNFEILAFVQAEDPHFTYRHKLIEEADTPDGAELGHFIIKFTDTEFYNNKIMKFKVTACVQTEDGQNSWLYIYNINAETGKKLKAYKFPMLNW